MASYLFCLCFLFDIAGEKTPATVDGQVFIAGEVLQGGKVVFYFGLKSKVEVAIAKGSFGPKRTRTGRAKIVIVGRGVPTRYTSIKTTPLERTVTGGHTTYVLEIQ